MLSCIISLLLELLIVSLQLVDLLLKIGVFTTKRCLELLQSLSLLLILALPELFFACDTLNLALSLVLHLLSSLLHLVIEVAREFFIGLLKLFNLAIEELYLLLEKCLFASRLKLKLHGLILDFLQLLSRYL